MLRSIIFFVTFLFTSFIGTTQINLEVDLELYYPFNGNAGDSSGNAIHGVVYGGANPTVDRFGNANSAFNFDGINDYVDTETTFDYQFRTVSFWFKSDNNSGVRIILAQDANSLVYGSFHAQTNSNNLVGRAGGSPSVTIQNNIGTGNWHHLVLLRTNTFSYYYLNGELMTTSISNGVGSGSMPNDELVIAVNRTELDGFFDGIIDELRVYSRALNTEEIQALYCPTYPIISANDTTVLENTTLSFTNNAIEIDTMAWFVNGVYINSDSAFTYTFDSIGLYEIIAYGSDGFCQDYDTTYVVVEPEICNLSGSTTDSLLLNMPLNGSLINAGTLQPDISISGATATTNRFNQPNMAYNFDGSDFIEVEQNFDFNHKTFSFWFRATNTTGSGNTAKFIFAHDDLNNVFGSSGAWYTNGELHLKASSGGAEVITPNAPQNTWHHIALIRDNTATRYYLNGSLLLTGTSAGGGSTTTPNPFLVIGAGRSTTNQFFQGQIDDVKVYNRALSTEEVGVVYCPSQVEIIENDTIIYSPTTATFSTACTDYPLAWEIDGDTLSVDSSFTFTFSSPHLYQIILSSSDGYCVDRDTVIVHYLPDSTCLGTDTISKISSTSGNFNGILGNNDLFGMGVSTYPDINNDQIDEIIVGAPNNAAGGFERGAIFVLHVNNDGLVYDHYKIGSDSGNLGPGIDDEDNFGFSVDRIGDVNGDGIEDLAVGAPYDDDGGTNRGAVWILFMDTNGLVSSKQKISDTQGGLSEPLDNLDRFGIEVNGIGDLNNDGIPDIACGLTTDFVNGSNDGSVLILFLNANGTVNNEIKLNINSSQLSEVLTAGSAFGQAVEYLGDYNNDGLKDYAMGFGQHDGGGIDRGAFAILSLDTNGVVLQAHRITQNESGFNHPLDNSGNFGSAIANLGDVDGDGYLEIAVGNWRDNTGGSERGATWILSLDSNGYVFNTHKIDNNTSGLALDNNDRFGRSLAVINDFNNDGINDLVVGARQDDDGGIDRGAIYLISLRDTCCPLIASFNASSESICPNETISFTNTSSFLTSGATYQWFVNNVEVANSFNFNHTFNTTGSQFIELVVTDSCVRSYGLTIMVNPNPTANAGSSQFLCLGDTTQLLASGGTNYQWSNGTTLSNDTIANPLAHPTTSVIYFVTVTDINGCSDIDDVAIIINPLPNISIAGDSVICPGLNATLTASGATSYTWEPATSLNNSTGATVISSATITTTYIVEGSDANNCSSIDSFTLTVDTSMSAAISFIQDASCFGNNDGFAVAAATGGTQPYNYTWSNGSITDTATSLNAGTYVAIVTDDEGCIDSISVFVNQPDSITISGTVNNALCFGQNSGSINAVPTGGTPPYQYAWSNAGFGPTISSLAAGNYLVTVTDDNSCENSMTFLVGEPTPLVPSIISSNNILCTGGNNGNASASASGGTPPYTFSWSNGSNSASANSLIAGTHTLTVTDFNGCTSTTQVNLTEPSLALVASITGITNVLCNGGNNGAISASAIGGTPPYSFSWSNMAATPTISALTAGNYTVTITDANGCTAINSASVTEPTTLALNFNVINTVSCYGGNDGAATAIPTGGTAPYAYAWAAGSSTSSQTSLTAGSHLVTVSDNNGCAVVGSVLISEPPVLISSTSVIENVDCNGAATGEALAAATGGTLPYFFVWSSGDTTAFTGNNPAGIYAVTVTDLNGCSDESSISISEPSVLTALIDSTFNVLCNSGNDGFALGSATGGTSPYSFAWSNGSLLQSASNLTAGVYNLTVTDINGCTDTNHAIILEPSMLLTTAAENSPALCFGDSNGTATASASGGTAPYTYLWESGETTSQATLLWAGLRIVTITDANGCFQTTNVLIGEPPLLQVSIDSTKDVICNGFFDGAAFTSSSGGTSPYQFNWNSGQTLDDIDSLTSGIYVISVTDSNGCIDTASVQIIELDPIEPNINHTNVSCFDGNDGFINSAVTGGGNLFNYLWNTGSTSIGLIGLSQGTYSLTVTDENGCFGIDSATLTQPDSIMFLTSATPISCHGLNNGVASFTISGGTYPYNYSWSNGNVDTIDTGLSEGVYFITITDANNCTNTDSILISEPSPISITTSLIDSVSCFGFSDGIGLVQAFGGVGNYSYSWSNSTSNDSLTNVAQGIYAITVIDSNGCEEVGSLSILEPDSLYIVLDSILNTQCFGEEDGLLTVNSVGGNGGVTYLWITNDTSNSIINLGAGNYGVTVTDYKGCQASADYFIDEPDTSLYLDSVLIVDAYCQGGSVGGISVLVAGATAPYTYLWSNNASSSSINSIVAGIYSLTITDANGCSIDTSFTVNQPIAPDTAITNPTNVTCFGEDDGIISAQFVGGIAPFTYAWSNNAVSQTINNLSPGIYQVTLTDAIGCIQLGIDSIAEPDQLSVMISLVDSILCNGDSSAGLAALTTGGTEPYSFIWSTGALNDSISGLISGSYFVDITDANGCLATDDINVTEPGLLTFDSLSIVNTSCHGFSNGEIHLFLEGGSLPLTYTWSNGDTTSTINQISAGGYSVTVTDLFDCSIDTSITILQPDSLILETEILDSALCINQANGNLTTNITGGTTPYNYIWSNGATSSTINNVVTGVYSVTVTDQLGCIDSSTTLLPYKFELPVSGLNPDTTLCEAFSHLLAVNQGYSQYLWSTGSTQHVTTVTSPGIYFVTIESSEGCTLIDSIQIQFGAPTLFTLGNDTIICVDENPSSLILRPSPNIFTSYQWSNGASSDSIIVTSTGAITLNAINQAGCITSDDIIVVFDTCRNVNVSEFVTVLPFKVFPNPTRDLLYFEWSVPPGSEVLYNIRSAEGRIVSSAASREQRLNFNLTELAAGIYVLDIQSAKFSQQVRIIHQ